MNFAAAAEAKLRPQTMIAKPVRLDPTFEDPEAVLDPVRRSAPYPLSARVHKKDGRGDDVPFFRIFWVHARTVPDEGWVPPLRGDQVRLSLLWKAYAFANQAAAEEYRNRSNDLDHASVQSLFEADLRQRGIRFSPAGDPVGDPARKAVLQDSYPPAFVA